MGKQKNAEIWDFFKNKNTDFYRWFVFGICLTLFYPKFHTHVNYKKYNTGFAAFARYIKNKTAVSGG